jgi:hypothetical protein
MKTSIEKLVDRLKNELGILADSKSFKRVYAGYWQRSKGAWSWSMNISGTNQFIGSQSSVGELLKAKRISEYTYLMDIHIDPIN